MGSSKMELGGAENKKSEGVPIPRATLRAPLPLYASYQGGSLPTILELAYDCR